MNVESSSRRNNRKKMFCLKCGNFIFGISTALFMTILYWLYFDLQQEISEYRRKIDEGKYKYNYKKCFNININVIKFGIIPSYSVCNK